MWWRITSKEFEVDAGERLKTMLGRLVATGPPPGLLGYAGDEPIGWVSLGDRSEFGRLNRSPKLKPIDERPACSVVCFFIHRDHRSSGVAAELLDAAVEEARARGYSLVEGYPIDTSTAKRPAADLFTGTLPLFERAGFRVMKRRGGRPIVRLET